jgi:NTE family protein
MSDGNRAPGHNQGRPIPIGPVAIVLAGAGARGAYEAGFVATLLPHLRPRPTIFVGTSAGAINAALLASVAHLPPEAAGDRIMASWSKLHAARVFQPLWKSLPRALAQYIRAIALGSEPPESLADTTPLPEALTDPELLDWSQLARNVESGVLDAVGVAATETGSGRTKLFYQTKPGWVAAPRSLLTRAAGPNGHGKHKTAAVHSDESQAIDYVATALDERHVRASAAIPVLFPPVAIETNGRKSFLIDGGIRLNAPLKPALELGADGVIVVATDPRHFGTSLAVEPKPPSMQGQVLQLLRAVFADRMIEDIHVLLSRNRKAQKALDEGGKTDDRVVPIIFGGPLDQDRLGGVAARAVDELLKGPPWQRYFHHLDVALLSLVLRVCAASAPDLLSYILFEPLFIRGALRAGIQDASALLNDYPSPADLWHALGDRDLRHRQPRPDPATVPL